MEAWRDSAFEMNVMEEVTTLGGKGQSTKRTNNHLRFSKIPSRQLLEFSVRLHHIVRRTCDRRQEGRSSKDTGSVAMDGIKTTWAYWRL